MEMLNYPIEYLTSDMIRVIQQDHDFRQVTSLKPHDDYFHHLEEGCSTLKQFLVTQS